MIPPFRFTMYRVDFVLGLILMVLCIAVTSPAQSPPAKPNEASSDVPSMTIVEAKEVAKSAYAVLQNGTNDPHKIEQLVKGLGRATQAVGLAPHQKELLLKLEQGLKAVQSISLDGWEDAMQQIQKDLLPQTIRTDFAGADSKRRKKVRDAAAIIAEEYLAIGDLADKLSLTNQEFLQVLKAREVLAKDIRSLGAHVPLNLSSSEEAAVKKVVDLWIVDPDQTSKPDSGTMLMKTPKKVNHLEQLGESDRLARIKEWLERTNKSVAGSVEPFSATVEDLIQVSMLRNDRDGKSLEEINKVLDSIPLLKQHASLKGEDGSPLTPTSKEIQIKQVACRLLFWQVFSDRVSIVVLRANAATYSDIAFDPRFKDEKINVDFKGKAEESLKRVIEAIEKSSK